MQVHNVEQGTPEWYAARLGIPTASEFDKIITPTGLASKQADAYANKLIAEMLAGNADTFAGTEWTNRGKELEGDAAAFYEFTTEQLTEPVGFVTADDIGAGCSPDRLVGENGLLEIKIPAPHTHVAYMLKANVDREYYPQLQGQLLVTGRQWVDIISYHPTMRSVIIRVERDEEYLKTMRELLGKFNQTLTDKKAKLVELGFMEGANVVSQ